ncbi:PUA-like domain-containing protein [Flagelloscypha sp. PMI_526]|nr:PUA-like domain-containing protein [Flagelloscypha sp. PMI_526]
MEAIRKRMMESDLYDKSLMQTEAKGKEYGSIKGINVFDTFASRNEMSKNYLHRHTIAGIHGSEVNGAQSIVLSYKYEDDNDQGNIIQYTGTSPDDQDRLDGGPRKLDQSFEHPHNAALKRSKDTEFPVRVIRGPNPKPKEGEVNWAPAFGYRYDGLYKVTEAKYRRGKGGNRICHYILERLPNQPDLSLRNGRYSGQAVPQAHVNARASSSRTGATFAQQQKRVLQPQPAEGEALPSEDSTNKESHIPVRPIGKPLTNNLKRNRSENSIEASEQPSSTVKRSKTNIEDTHHPQ